MSKAVTTMEAVLAVLLIISIVISAVAMTYILPLSAQLAYLSSGQEDIRTTTAELAGAEKDLATTLADLGKAVGAYAERIAAIEERIAEVEETMKPPPPPTPIVIGASLSLTGKYAKTGEYMENAYRLWEHDINEAGGILGRPVRLIIYDDRSDPATSAKLYEKLITVDKVDAILGPYASSVTFAASATTEKYKWPMISPMASAFYVWERNMTYLFQMEAPNYLWIHGPVELAGEQGIKKAAVISEDDLFCLDLAKYFKEGCVEKGIEIVYDEVVAREPKDLTVELAKARDAGAEMLFASTYFPGSKLAVTNAKEIGFSPKIFVAAVGPPMPDFQIALGPDAEYVCGMAEWVEQAAYPGNKEFIAAYTEMFGIPPDYHAPRLMVAVSS